MPRRANPFVPLLTLLLSAAPFAAASAADPAPPAKAGRNVTFVATSDSHYDAFQDEDRNARNRDTIEHLNKITELTWPEALGGGRVDRPRGVCLLGDVIDDGDKKVMG